MFDYRNKKYITFLKLCISITSAVVSVLPVIISASSDCLHIWHILLIFPCVLQVFLVATPVMNILDSYYTAQSKKGLIHEHDIYALFEENGTAKLHVSDIDTLPRYNVEIPETKVTMVPKEAFWIQDSDIWQETGEPTVRLLPTCVTCGKEFGMNFFEDSNFKHCPGCGSRITLVRIPTKYLETYKEQESKRGKLKEHT